MQENMLGNDICKFEAILFYPQRVNSWAPGRSDSNFKRVI